MLDRQPSVPNATILCRWLHLEMVTATVETVNTPHSKQLYQFSIVTVANYHNLSSLKQHKSIILLFQKSEVQDQSQWGKIKVLDSLYSFWRFQSRIHFLALSSFQRLPAFLGFITSPHYITFSPSVSVFTLPSVSHIPAFLRIPVITRCDRKIR